MRRAWRPLVIVLLVSAGCMLVTVSYLSRSGRSEGRPSGLKYAVVVADLNAVEQTIIDASREYSLPPRLFGCAIAAERAFNFQPYLEDLGSAIFGTSVGVAQVSTIAFRTTLDDLFQPDSLTHFRAGAFDAAAARSFFRPSLTARRYERKLHLLFDTKFNITAAAMILRHSLDRYDAAAPHLHVYRRPDLAATLYHRTFPLTITGVPDEFGLMALQFYHDPSFMPRSVQRKEVHHDR